MEAAMVFWGWRERKRWLRPSDCIVATALCVLLALTLGRAAAQPPDVVPEGLTAAQYFDLGKEYKAVGWPEQARDALTRSIKADPEGVGKKAAIYLRAYVPRYRVSNVAVQMNVRGYNQLARGDVAGAIRTFQECIAQFPDFEWPYGNLGSVYVEQGRTQEAKDILQKALTINPSYVNGWLHLATARLKEGDVNGAHEAARMAQQIDPDNPLAKLLLGPQT
jgi:Tfp pilus assembly protein PilF